MRRRRTAASRWWLEPSVSEPSHYMRAASAFVDLYYFPVLSHFALGRVAFCCSFFCFRNEGGGGALPRETSWRMRELVFDGKQKTWMIPHTLRGTRYEHAHYYYFSLLLLSTLHLSKLHSLFPLFLLLLLVFLLYCCHSTLYHVLSREVGR